MEKFYIEPKWQEALSQIGLDTLDKLLKFEDDHCCVSRHKRGKTFKITLPNNQIIFLKRDNLTYKKEIIHDLFRFKRPEPNTEKERKNFLLAEQNNFHVPTVIAWGQRRRCGFPTQAAMIMLPLNGVSLDNYIKNNPDSFQKYILKATNTLVQLQNLGFYWPDYKPEHFFVMENEEIGLIDLERMKNRKHPLSNIVQKKQLEKFRKLLDEILENVSKS